MKQFRYQSLSIVIIVLIMVFIGVTDCGFKDSNGDEDTEKEPITEQTSQNENQSHSAPIVDQSAMEPLQYIESLPLSQVINLTAGDVDTGNVIPLPLISWGGDIVTIYANGNSRTTANGSIFDDYGLKFELVREDIFAEQVRRYIQGETPYLRGTMGMIGMAIEALNRSPDTKPVIVYQMTWSEGGDAIVVKENIQSPEDLNGKTIAVQAYGPHVDYIARILKDAGLSMSDVNIVWTRDLTGTLNSPAEAFAQDNVDAAMVILPDALALTSNGTVGTGAEGSILGAKILLSTKTANRIISDVYAVRSDYFQANKSKVQSFVYALMKAEEELQVLIQNKSQRTDEYNQVFSAAGLILLDSEQAIADAEGMYYDANHVGFPGNVKFFADNNYPRRLAVLADEIQDSFMQIGLINRKYGIDQAQWDYEELKQGLSNTADVVIPRFNQEGIAQYVAEQYSDNTENENVLFSFEVHFEPNQAEFPDALYSASFSRVIELASIYGGAVITAEGHSDPLKYCQEQRAGATQVELRELRQAAKNLSLARAEQVRDSIISFSQRQGITLDPSQFTIFGHGIENPKSGTDNGEPVPPQTEEAWKDNMRVEFKIYQVEAESNVFVRLN